MLASADNRANVERGWHWVDRRSWALYGGRAGSAGISRVLPWPSSVVPGGTVPAADTVNIDHVGAPSWFMMRDVARSERASAWSLLPTARCETRRVTRNTIAPQRVVTLNDPSPPPARQKIRRSVPTAIANLRTLTCQFSRDFYVFSAESSAGVFVSTNVLQIIVMLSC